MAENDPKTATDPKTTTEEKAPKVEPARDTWKPKAGGSCTVVYMRGGPLFVERPAKIVKVSSDGRATVEYLTDRGRTARVEGLEYVARGTVWSSACYTSPQD